MRSDALARGVETLPFEVFQFSNKFNRTAIFYSSAPVVESNNSIPSLS